eukprot:m.430935 g.430935  ORF g.430935 m.430935 type:complete len:773 (+) comp56733_c0_seq17:701-3019(+)
MSYDEMAISALIGLSGPTFFINSGSRSNSGQPGGLGTFERTGIYAALVGARFERPGLMEYAHCIVTPQQNTAANGYGPDAPSQLCRTMILRLWAEYYTIGGPLGPYFPTFEEANAQFLEDQALPQHQQRFILLREGGYLNVRAYKERMIRSILPFLLEANLQAQMQHKQAYCHVVGLGLGVWMVSPLQTVIMVQIYSELLQRHPFPSISDLDFSYFGSEAQSVFPNGELFQSPNGNCIRIRFSERDPASKLSREDEQKLLVAMFAWDANSFVGNEYWKGMLTASGDPAAAACSLIPQLLNPEINPFIRASRCQVFLQAGQPMHQASQSVPSNPAFIPPAARAHSHSRAMSLDLQAPAISSPGFSLPFTPPNSQQAQQFSFPAPLVPSHPQLHFQQQLPATHQSQQPIPKFAPVESHSSSNPSIPLAAPTSFPFAQPLSQPPPPFSSVPQHQAHPPSSQRFSSPLSQPVLPSLDPVLPSLGPPMPLMQPTQQTPVFTNAAFMATPPLLPQQPSFPAALPAHTHAPLHFPSSQQQQEQPQHHQQQHLQQEAQPFSASQPTSDMQHQQFPPLQQYSLSAQSTPFQVQQHLSMQAQQKWQQEQHQAQVRQELQQLEQRKQQLQQQLQQGPQQQQLQQQQIQQQLSGAALTQSFSLPASQQFPPSVSPYGQLPQAQLSSSLSVPATQRPPSIVLQPPQTAQFIPQVCESPLIFSPSLARFVLFLCNLSRLDQTGAPILQPAVDDRGSGVAGFAVPSKRRIQQDPLSDADSSDDNDNP